MQSKIKILIGCHKPTDIIESDILEFMHAGRAIAREASKDGRISESEHEWMIANTIGDDTGENISEKNRKFCELTILYWAWKNYARLENPDYIGFMHYRRFFDFRERKCSSEWKPSVDEEGVRAIISKADIITPIPKKMGINGAKQFIKHHFYIGEKALEEAFEIVRKMYPEDIRYLKEYLNNDNLYFYNMFVMKREYFFEYCEWIFSILFELEKKIDIENSSTYDQRMLGFIAERLTGCFFVKKKNEKKKIIERDIMVNLLENKKDNKLDKNLSFDENIAICFSIDNNYVPYLSVALTSLIENSNDNKRYDIYILCDNVKNYNKKKLQKISQNKDNITIIFKDISEYLSKDLVDKMYVKNHFTQSTYYRFLLPYIFPNNSKMIYLDSDIVVLTDVSIIYDSLSDETTIAAVKDSEVFRLLYSEQRTGGCFFHNYFSKELKLKDNYSYIQAGVLVLNLVKLREINFTDLCFDKLSEVRAPFFLDQCILNSLIQNDKRIKIDYLDLSWNVEWHLALKNENLSHTMPSQCYKEYFKSRNDPKIIHYCGDIKPWKNPELEFSHYFWHYARQTPFYEQIIYENYKKNTKELVTKVKNSEKIKRKYYLYSILSKVAIVGRWKRKFRKKKEHYKKEKKFLDGILK